MQHTRFSIEEPKQPSKKIISFEDYCRHMDAEQTDAGSETALFQRIRRQGARRHLEVFCLLLEAGVCIAALLVLISAAQGLFAR